MLPRNIFQTYTTKNDVFTNYQLKTAARSWNVPGFNYHFYTEEERDSFIETSYPNFFNDYSSASPTLRLEIWKYCVIYKYGGIYADIDIRLTSSPEIFINNKMVIVSPETSCNRVFSAPPNSPILESILEYSLKCTKPDIFIQSGRLFTDAVNDYLKKCSGENPTIVIDFNQLIFKEPVAKKTIYMTYKNSVPPKVFGRWKATNPGYDIEFSLNPECIDFLKTNFNEYIARLFVEIPCGPHKADLWRLCKLYLHSGVYADIDLVPYINIDAIVNNNITFYSCLSIVGKSIFQAFIINNSSPRNPLILCFLLSFLINRPYLNGYSGPTEDMYQAIAYNTNNYNLKAETPYSMDKVKLKINVGSSQLSQKIIHLFYFPDVPYTIEVHNGLEDAFNIKIKDNQLIVNKLDRLGWNNLSLDICFTSKETVFLFPERGSLNGIKHCFVSYKNRKILDSRDEEYYRNKGWTQGGNAPRRPPQGYPRMGYFQKMNYLRRLHAIRMRRQRMMRRIRRFRI